MLKQHAAAPSSHLQPAERRHVFVWVSSGCDFQFIWMRFMKQPMTHISTYIDRKTRVSNGCVWSFDILFGYLRSAVVLPVNILLLKPSRLSHTHTPPTFLPTKHLPTISHTLSLYKHVRRTLWKGPAVTIGCRTDAFGGRSPCQMVLSTNTLPLQHWPPKLFFHQFQDLISQTSNDGVNPYFKHK